jgi:hypothetical protein
MRVAIGWLRRWFTASDLTDGADNCFRAHRYDIDAFLIGGGP